MNRAEALQVQVGDKIMYKEYYAFEVKRVQYTTPKDLKCTAIVFYDKDGYSYNYKYCRKWVPKGGRIE